MECNKIQVQGLASGMETSHAGRWGRLGTNCLVSSSAKKALEVLVDKLNRNQQLYFKQHRPAACQYD